MYICTIYGMFLVCTIQLEKKGNTLRLNNFDCNGKHTQNIYFDTIFCLFCFSFFAYFLCLFTHFYVLFPIVPKLISSAFHIYPFASFTKIHISHNKYILAPDTPLRMRRVRHGLFKVRLNVFLGVLHAT